MLVFTELLKTTYDKLIKQDNITVKSKDKNDKPVEKPLEEKSKNSKKGKK